MNAVSRDRAQARLQRLASEGRDVAGFFAAAGEVLETALEVGPDLQYWCAVDPSTYLMTSVHAPTCDMDLDALMYWEYVEDDFNKTADVARHPDGIQTLREATGGKPERSPVYRDYCRPRGLDEEVLVALRSRCGDTWGSVRLTRRVGDPQFDRADLGFLRAVAPLLADGVRRGLLVGEATEPEWPDGPSMLVLDRHLNIESMSPGMDRWLAELVGAGSARRAVPPSVLAVAARVVRRLDGDGPPDDVPLARVRANDGRWLVLHGTPLATAGPSKVAVIAEPASPDRILSLLMAVHELTPRERDITRLVLRGAPTTEIASELGIAPQTVQQHLKSIFDKTGTRSRRALVSQVFFHHYGPRVRDNRVRSVDGKPVRGGPAVRSPQEYLPSSVIPLS